jgi:beta-N-acetylhexosaminidase
MSRTSIDERAARLVMAAPSGRRLTADERALLADRSIGHLILFGRNLVDREEARDLIAEARSLLGRSPLVAVDQEGGIVAAASRLVGTPPSAMHLGAGGGPGRVRAWAMRQAALLRAVGINMNLAPVLDVQGEPWSRVIGSRSFGGRPGAVAALGVSAVRGYLAGGVLPVGKHFPGHGGVAADSHLTLPVDRRSARAIRASALPPFRAAFGAGLPAVMIAHVSYPRLGTGKLPATVSPEVIGTLLRGSLGFGGVVMSDALEMAGFPGERLIPAALRAGIDLFCVSRSIRAGRRVALVLSRAAAEGSVERARLLDAERRVEALVSRLPRRKSSPPEAPAGEWRGIVRRGPGAFRPLSGDDWIALLPARLAGRLPVPVDLSGIASRFGEPFVRERVRLYPPEPSAAEIRGLLRSARGKTVVLGVLGRGELPAGQQRLLRALRSRPERLLAVALLDPGPLAAERGIEALFSFDFRKETLVALFEILTGKRRPEGVLPFAIR